MRKFLLTCLALISVIALISVLRATSVYAGECSGTINGQAVSFDISFDPDPVPAADRLRVVVMSAGGNFSPDGVSIVDENGNVWSTANLNESQDDSIWEARLGSYENLSPDLSYSVILYRHDETVSLSCPGFIPDPRAERDDYVDDYMVASSSYAGLPGDMISVTVDKLSEGASPPKKVIVHNANNSYRQEVDLIEVQSVEPKSYKGIWRAGAPGEYSFGLITERDFDFPDAVSFPVTIYDSPHHIYFFPSRGMLGTTFNFKVTKRTQRTPTGIVLKGSAGIFPVTIKGFANKFTVPLYNDGRHDDEGANDALYAATWTPAKTGRYQVGIIDNRGETMTSLNVDVYDESNFSKECIPIVPELNNAAEDRINIVFVGVRYDNTDEMRASMLSFLKDYVDVKKQHEGIRTVEPYKSVPLFNYWFVPDMGRRSLYRVVEGKQTMSTGEKLDAMAASLACPFENKVVVALINRQFRTGASFEGRYVSLSMPVERFYESATSSAKIADYKMIHHELGHAIWDLSDLYVWFDNPAVESVDSPTCYGPASDLRHCLNDSSWHDMVGTGCGRPNTIDCPYDPSRGCADESCHEVGCFEGACYYPNLWRPQMNNLMRRFEGLPGEKSTYGIGLKTICQKLRDGYNYSEGICR